MVITLENVLELAKAGNVYSDTALYTDEGKFRMLKEDVTFLLPDGKLLHIQKGMIWDENSIPWFLQWLFPKSGKYAPPALVHDALYYDTTTSQEYADNVYRQFLEAVKASAFQVKWRYWGVSKFGDSWWRKNKYHPGPRVIHNRKLITIT
jgi:hypothetical protein